MIHINPASPVSKYRQIIQSVIDSISNKTVKTGDKIPSINQICKSWNLSRDTVVNAYNELKMLGIISSAPGKGFYIASSNIKVTSNIFLLFDELNGFKEDIYNSFLENLPKGAVVDLYFHYFNRRFFDQLIKEAQGNYNTFVIMPVKFKDTYPIIRQLTGRVIILDQLPDDLAGHFPAIYQDFESDVYNALMSGEKLFKQYSHLVMVHPGGKEPEELYKGFLRYCEETKTTHELIHNLKGRHIKKGEAYLVIDDRDLVWLMKEAKKTGLKPGRELGIVSFNDKPLKEVTGSSGITTISTDFKLMGATLAKIITEKTNTIIKNPSSLIIRGSL